MKRRETPEEVRRWFQEAVRDLWPVAVGSLSYRKSPCIRPNCKLCESGQGHWSHALYGKKGKRRFSIYIPDELAPEVERAVKNGRSFQQLIAEAGRRYAIALKGERPTRKKK
jgi:hypothetical protein